MFSTHKISLFIISLMAICYPVYAQVSLPPGGNVSVPGTNAIANPALIGTVVADKIDYLYVHEATIPDQVFSGTLEQTVIRENISGTLDFYLKFSEDNLANVPLTFIDYGKSSFFPNEIGFGHSSTGVGYLTDSPGQIAPVQAYRSLDGESLSITFPDLPTDIGNATFSLFVQTDAREYALQTEVTPFGGPVTQTNGLLVSIGHIFPGFAPQAVPEPGLLPLLIGASISGWLVICRRSR